MQITPTDQPGDSRTGSLSGITAAQINEILGFKPNVKDDPYKVKYSWGFHVDGVRCGVWDYKGSGEHGMFSTFGPSSALRSLFGDNYHG